MVDVASILSQRIRFDPAIEMEGFLKSLPAKPAIYLLADERDQPLQLLSVRNLRASLKRRLALDDSPVPSRKISYRDCVRSIHYQRVDSYFEADVAYLEAARRIFPQTYRSLTTTRQAFFVHVDPKSAFPRLVRTADPCQKAGVTLGPLLDKHAAARFIEEVENTFDLCRYYTTLTQAPRGKACAYKEMGRCDAPCDGSVSMGSYRERVGRAVMGAIEPGSEAARQTAAMKQAASALRFEEAARIKAMLDRLSRLSASAFRHVDRVENFRFVSMQPGPRAGSGKVFLITPGGVEWVASLIGEPGGGGEIQRLAQARSPEVPSAEMISLVTHHLFSPKSAPPAFVRVDALNDKSIKQAYRSLLKQKPAEGDEEEEGVQGELRAM
jgi:excinuclease UvrABC nuclease subunit